MNQELQEYHIRRKSFDINGYRAVLNLDNKRSISEEFCIYNNSISTISDDLDYNMLFEGKGKFCVSEEMGYVHLYFEEGKFKDEEIEALIKGFCNYCEAVYSVKDLEYFRSDF